MKRNPENVAHIDELLIEAVKNSKSIRQAAIKLKADHHQVSKRIKDLNLDTSHMDRTWTRTVTKYTKYIGQQFGYCLLKAITPNPNKSQDKHGRKFAHCKCLNCGNEDFFTSIHNLLNGCTKSCGCSREHIKMNTNHPLWKGYGRISKSFWTHLYNNATGREGRVTQRRNKDMEFTITIEYMWELFLKQEERCALSGVLLDFGDTYKARGTASVDRIDNSKGYIPGNVQWVHKKINLIKQYLSDEEFIDWCEKVTNRQRKDYEVCRKIGGCDLL